MVNEVYEKTRMRRAGAECGGGWLGSEASVKMAGICMVFMFHDIGKAVKAAAFDNPSLKTRTSLQTTI